MPTPDEFDEYFSDEDVYKAPRDMVTAANHFTRLDLGGAETLDKYLSCPVCLSVMDQPTATECLHRFCSGCIETALRIGKKECPSCRFPIATRRALRRDRNFEALMRTLYPTGPPDSDEEIDLGAYTFVPLRAPNIPQRPYRIDEDVSREETSASLSNKERKESKARLPRLPPSNTGANELPVPSERRPRKGGKAQQPSPMPPHQQHRRYVLEPDHQADGVDVIAESEEKRARWSCMQCTLINSAAARKCKVCEAPNPSRAMARGRKDRTAPGTIVGSAVEQTLADGVQPTDGVAKYDKASRSGANSASAVSAMPSRSRASLTGDAVSVPIELDTMDNRKGKRNAPVASEHETTKAGKRAPRLLEDAESEKRQREERYTARKEPRAEESLRNAVQPEPELDLGAEAPSIEAQLLARHTFSLHIKTADETGVVVLWSFPTANPGDCSAWISLAPAALVTEASARSKFKLITKNKMFGECRFSWAEMMRLRDGRYAFGLLATIDGVQLVLAVSRAIRKESGQLLPGPDERELMRGTVCVRDDSVGSGIGIHDSSDEYGDTLETQQGAFVTGETEAEDAEEADEEEADEEEADEEEADEEEAGDGEAGEDEGETIAVHSDRESNSADAPNDLRVSGHLAFQVSRPPASAHAVAGPDLGLRAGTTGHEHGSSGHELSSHVPPKKLASRRAALSAKAMRSKARWSPRVDVGVFTMVALAILSVLQKCGPRGSHALLTPTMNALMRLPQRPATLTPREILLDTLRILVRSQIVSRQRERSVRTLPTYAVAPHGLAQLHIAAPRQSASRSQPLASESTAQREQRNAAQPACASLQADTSSQISQSLPSCLLRGTTEPCTPPADVRSAVALAPEAAIAPPHPAPHSKTFSCALSFVEADGQGYSQGHAEQSEEPTLMHKSGAAEEPALKRKASDASSGKARYRISRKRTA